MVRVIEKNRKRLARMIIILASCLVIVLVFDRLIFPLPLSRLYKSSSTFVYSRDKHLMGGYISSDGYWRKPVKLSEISPLLQKSVLACEDQWFYYHPGVNIVSLARAAYDDLKAGKIVRGGSTISMQVARMMEPKSRTIKSKVVEILRAFQLEFHYSKKELLELYFNMVPYGGNIEGVGAAAYFYFGKLPVELSASQAALLTSIPNSPEALRPDINSQKSVSARTKVLGVMLKKHIITDSEYAEALSEEAISKKYDPPSIAPHFSREIASRNRGQSEVVTTIDLKMQNVCDEIINNHRGNLKARGINNAAIVLINNATAEILAMVGSSDFNDNRHQGQVNGAMSPRSPGSALKPFVYAMALDKGLISPNLILEDLPVYYSGYSPENYDRQYRGIVSAAEALRLSLNVPAVTICAKVGQKNFFSLLKAGRISTLNQKDSDYGLPLILGSCEVTLLDLTMLYSSLARNGTFIPYKMETSSPTGDSVSLFTPASAYLISEILSELQRPDFPASWEFSPNIPRVAWKTGTSYGRKDAWSIGYNPTYTVGVWVGNFSGESSPDLVGADAAAPILFEIFKAIGSDNNNRWFSKPANIESRMVCGISGMPPSQLCLSVVEERYIYDISPSAVCNIHKEIMIDSISGVRLCRYCTTGKKTTSKVVEDWPPKIATWLANSGHQIAVVPEHNSACTGTYFGDRPVIVSPNADATYIIRRHIPSNQQGIPLEASAAAGTNYIYWFVDGELYGQTPIGGRLFYTPVAGTHNLVCADNEGRSSSITLKIQ